MILKSNISNNREKSLEKYLRDIEKYDLLTPDEEVDLARKIRQNDNDALEKLVNANLRFVINVAKQYQNQGLALVDLISEGNLGLIKAAVRYDETRGFKFISYAVWWIKQTILQAISDQSRMIRIPMNKIGDLRKMNKIYTRLSQDYEREPSNDEIANEMGVDTDLIYETKKLDRSKLSLDSSIKKGEPNGQSLINFIPNNEIKSPDSTLLYESLKIDLEKILKTLSEKEEDIIKLYFGINRGRQFTLEEIAEMYNISRERARQIKEKALKRLKHISRSSVLRAYLG
jgi:RNA polymerase primary sigma factor